MIATGSGTKEENKVSAVAERFCLRFSLAEVQLATQDFSEAHLIGNGGFGKVYKGQIDNGQQTVAIKRLASNSNQGEDEFLTEIETLSKLRHVNLVSLIGYCNENGEMILVYEYIARGTLADHLYKLSRSSEGDDFSSITWKQRLIICIGAGRGLDYLHTGTSIVHRDVKSTNILLDENFTAKVSDFGLAKHFTSHSKSHVSTTVKGTFGYLDPSYFTTCKLTRKSDIYAFGVVLLEVLCGRQAVDQRLGEDEMSLVMWAQEKFSKGKAYQIVASNLCDEVSSDCLKTFVGIARRCLNREPKKRPTMAQVVVQLQFALEQQDRKVATLNASRFLPFWNRVKPSGSRATQEEALNVEQTVNMLPVAVIAIPIHELEDITDNFSSGCLIHNRSGENVYRGTLKSGQDAEIKKLCYSNLPDKEFLEKVSLVSSLKHENLAQLLGYCVDGRRQFLAYEYAQNGSLHDILHGFYGSNQVLALSWAQRVKIAVGAAKGLEYIHQKKHIHYDIRSCNVLVYNDGVVKLVGFGLPTHFAYKRLYDYSDDHPFAFMRPQDPPECILRDEVSWRCNVYCFGWVLLELLTGDKLFDHTQHLLERAGSKLSEDKVKQIVDGRLNGDYPPKAVAKVAVQRKRGSSQPRLKGSAVDFLLMRSSRPPEISMTEILLERVDSAKSTKVKSMMGNRVAMKRLATNSNQGEGEFLTEIETLSKLRHVNLVSLIGYCNESGEMILVYQYIPRGTLADHLYKLSRSSDNDECSSLTWKQRLNICIGAARGLDYLHTGSSIIHRDVKSTNILLDENFKAKVSDFGLAKHLSTSSSKSYVSTIVKGSFGYLDPSYFITCRLTRKSDTYAFGVVLLEVLCGRPAVDQRLGEDEMSLVMWAQEKINKGKIEQIVSSNLREEISADCLKTFVGIAKRCLNREPKKRPTMAQVVVQLEFALEQQDRGVPLLNASRFLPFWNRVKPSGSRAKVSTAIPSPERELAVNVLPNGVTTIPMHELEEITNNFSSEGSIGVQLYRGALKNGQVAAIKKMPCVSSYEFLNQVSLISSLKHENLAQLLGYCVDGDLQFFAYEFAPNGSLHDILHGKHGVRGSKPGLALSWGQRVKIATGAAKGLQYIHEKERVHSSIKSSNILLFDDYQAAKIADFGPSTLFARETQSTSESLLDSDYYHPSVHLRHAYYFSRYNRWSGEVSWRSDVYYFGVVLLELLTGRKLYDYTRPRVQQHLVNWATPRLSEDKVKEIMDARLNGDYPPKAAARMAAIAALCVQDEAEYRPVMSVVVRALRLILLGKHDT